LRYLLERNRLRVIVSAMAAASATSPAIWALRTGARAEESAAVAAFRLVLRAGMADGLGAAEAAGAGEIAGNRPAALPAPISELETPLSSGRGPSGMMLSGSAFADDALAGDLADAEVTVTVASASGGVHFAVVTMLAVAVSFTELTLDATGICASRSTALSPETELTVQVAVLSPVVQPLVNVGFWLDGWAVSVTETSAAEPFSVETATVYAAVWPRSMLDFAGLTLTQSSG
jgi:hypothetical protein